MFASLVRRLPSLLFAQQHISHHLAAAATPSSAVLSKAAAAAAVPCVSSSSSLPTAVLPRLVSSRCFQSTASSSAEEQHQQQQQNQEEQQLQQHQEESPSSLPVAQPSGMAGATAAVVPTSSAAAPVLPQHAYSQMANGAMPLPGARTPGLSQVTPSSGSGAAVAVATPVGQTCNILSECVVKADELRMQMRLQEQGDTTTQLITREGYNEYVEELKLGAAQEIGQLVEGVKQNQGLMHQAGMSELRRTLYYAITLKNKHWIEEHQYETMMKALSLEFLRRDFDGAMSSDDVLFISTHVIISNYYNRQLWNRMEQSLFKTRAFENIELATIKGLSTKLYRSLRDSRPEALDIRRKILNAMSRRVGVLANDFDLPALLGILQCYTRHDLMPRAVEPLVHRAINHINDFTPHECAALTNVIRKWGLMRLEVAERLIERMCITERMSTSMIQCSLTSIRTCFSRIAEGGRGAVNSEPMKQKLRAMGEQVAGRLDEVAYPSLPMLLSALDILLQVRIYVPKKCLQNLFQQANIFIGHAIQNNGEVPAHLVPTVGSQLDLDEANRFSFSSAGAASFAAGDTLMALQPGGLGDDLASPLRNPRPKLFNNNRPRPITTEHARQLQGFLLHFGNDLCPELAARLKQAFKDGVFPDEASVWA